MIGSRLGSYEITAKLGEGGMGEVWRATDTKLKRDVAIKVLPAEFVQDRERLARFEREAQLLAQLHHPNIASIFGLEESGGTRALVMELVEGPTLAERIASGPIEVGDCVAIARQIAVALEEAHEKGIVHRDLKPANVKVDDENRVKVLDFGLAKAMSSESGIGSAASLANSPTLTQGATVEGVILGTAAYMSPEQAKGKAVDKRADVWAFGVVLFEMLVGRKLFEAETLPETLGAIFRQEIDLDELPAATPPRLRRLVERCLEREPKRRLRDIGEARIALEAIAAGESEPMAAPVPTRPSGVSWPVFAVAVAGVGAIAGLLAWRSAGPPAAGVAVGPEVTEFSIPVDDLVGFEISPDGRRIAWKARNRQDAAGDRSEGSSSDTLWVRALDDRVPREIVSDPDIGWFFFSPDGTQVVAALGGKLWRFPSAGGDRQPVCTLPEVEGVPESSIIAGAWLPDDTLVVAMWRGGLYRVPARGGEPEVLAPIDPEADVDFHEVVALPDGKSLLLTAHHQANDDAGAPRSSLEIFRDGRRTAVAGLEDFGEVWRAGYAAGALVLASAGSDESSIWGVPFDAGRAVVAGKRFLIAQQVGTGVVGRDGTLVYVPERERPAIVARVDREGREIATLGEEHARLDRPVLSPDGSRLAVVLDDNELWVEDLARRTRTRLVREEDGVEDPQWSPDGRALYYAAGNSGRFRRIRADPGAQPETVLDDAFRAFLAPDGSGLLLRKGGFKLSKEQGLYWAPFEADGLPGERRKLLGGFDAYGRLSPDGRLLAYGEWIGSRREAFLATFPDLDQTLQLSSNGGGTPQWRPDGKAVEYLSGGSLVEVAVGFDAAGRLTASPERNLFDLAAAGVRAGGWTVAPDGNGFLFVRPLATDNRSEIVVVRNGLQRALAGSR